MKKVAIGIDIGGTNTVFGIVDKKGNILAQNSMSSRKYEKIEDYLRILYKKIESLIADISLDIQLVGAGIGAPNGNYYKGTIEHAMNLRWHGVIPFVEMFQYYCNQPVYLTNDANAAAIGEMVYGAAKNVKDFVMITLGTGLGSGIVVNNELVYGHDGFAGEIGHTSVTPDGRQCNCGKKGCLETYVSATGIKRTIYELLANRNDDSELRNIPFNELNAKKVSELALEGDPIANEAFDYTGKILGLKLADAVAHTSPKVIYLFGGLANAGDLILNPTKKYFEESLLPIYRNKIEIRRSGLSENGAAILGASALVWKEDLSISNIYE